MYRILHASSDYFYCSFEFENLETGEHIFAHFFDDIYEELFQKFGLKQGQTLDGKVIAHIPPYFCICTEKRAKEISQTPFDSAWLFPWLRDSVKGERGDTRRGPGRPRNDSESISIQLPKKSADFIRKSAKKENITIEEWILQHLDVKE